jgi:hypothetical protein
LKSNESLRKHSKGSRISPNDHRHAACLFASPSNPALTFIMLHSSVFGVEPTTTQVERVPSRSQQMRLEKAASKLRASGTISRNSSTSHYNNNHNNINNPNNHHNNNINSNGLKDSNAVNHRILSTGEYSDLKLVCHGREYHVHKAIVCPQVAFLEGACREGFRVCHTISCLPKQMSSLMRALIGM